MNRISLMKALSMLCIVAGLACKLFIPNTILGATLAIILMATAIVILAIAMQRNKRR